MFMSKEENLFSSPKEKAQETIVLDDKFSYMRILKSLTLEKREALNLEVFELQNFLICNKEK